MKEEYFAIELSQSVFLALPLEDMETITRINPQQICSIPGVAPFWVGVVNQGGSLLWLLDSARFFELTPTNSRLEQNLTAVILCRQVEGTQRRVALWVQELKGVVTLEDSPELLPENLPLSSGFQSLLSGIVEHDGQTLGLLASEALFQALTINN